MPTRVTTREIPAQPPVAAFPLALSKTSKATLRGIAQHYGLNTEGTCDDLRASISEYMSRIPDQLRASTRNNYLLRGAAIVPALSAIAAYAFGGKTPEPLPSPPSQIPLPANVSSSHLGNDCLPRLEICLAGAAAKSSLFRALQDGKNTCDALLQQRTDETNGLQQALLATSQQCEVDLAEAQKTIALLRSTERGLRAIIQQLVSERNTRQEAGILTRQRIFELEGQITHSKNILEERSRNLETEKQRLEDLQQQSNEESIQSRNKLAETKVEIETLKSERTA
ncbi:MAG: hypothetical protein FJZ64_03140, partial [Chlamydiae bacterium]|nr:hypothetical protein [Chlamydiota bacterium]